MKPTGAAIWERSKNKRLSCDFYQLVRINLGPHSISFSILLEFASVEMLHKTLMHIIRLCFKIHSNLCSGDTGHKALAITN